jgi:hypothetical protein
MANLAPFALTALFYKCGMPQVMIADCRRVASTDYVADYVDFMSAAHLYWVRVVGQSPAVNDYIYRAQPAMPAEFNNIALVGTDDYEGLVLLRYSR